MKNSLGYFGSTNEEKNSALSLQGRVCWHVSSAMTRQVAQLRRAWLQKAG
jgi:hypothetical protein